jgi:subtilisin family serine protease
MPDVPAAPTHSSVDITRAEPALLRPATGDPGREITVVVLDTGLAATSVGGSIPHVSARAEEPWGPTKPATMTDNEDEPDDNNDDWLDPVAGHGTFIAALISRLAPTAAVSVGRVLENTGEGNDADIAWRINRLVDEGAPDILSLSCSCYTEDDVEPLALAEAVARIQAAGTLVVSSAGNDATCRVTWPAALPGVIAVGALGPYGPAPFTNHGPWIDCCAPGVEIVSHFFDGIDEHDDNNPATADFRGWAKWSGTSFSGPIVAGVIAREAALYGISVAAAVERVVMDKRLFRFPGLGTVVNVH